ncbi:hypothetical protein HNR21_001667 [Actinomadura cellulosilytica]|uniref:Uncharacterized protein n=1 Tax=Thermomonospora cellulosilytica TaxID=1411118 RepID=A0A7W3MVQ7_9ACTN|nr:hypothetical protein [Thermomonospora cellulosilytica]MBA9002785.1 hypothetical protein [Thermomonospora cellulosilytica]
MSGNGVVLLWRRHPEFTRAASAAVRTLPARLHHPGRRRPSWRGTPR